jgi:hypothetical protein
MSTLRRLAATTALAATAAFTTACGSVQKVTLPTGGELKFSIPPVPTIAVPVVGRVPVISLGVPPEGIYTYTAASGNWEIRHNPNLDVVNTSVSGDGYTRNFKVAPGDIGVAHRSNGEITVIPNRVTLVQRTNANAVEHRDRCVRDFADTACQAGGSRVTPPNTLTYGRNDLTSGGRPRSVTLTFQATCDRPRVIITNSGQIYNAVDCIVPRGGTGTMMDSTRRSQITFGYN